MTIITGSTYRFTFLTSRLVRLEEQAEGHFEDRPTTFARCRTFPDVDVKVSHRDGHLEADTEHLHLVLSAPAFSSASLTIQVRGSLTAYQSLWRYGEEAEPLGGTARTLDGADGEIEVSGSVLSRQGFAVLPDGSSMVLTEDGRFEAREHPETDLYFFGYGHDWEGCMRDFYRLSGEVPMLPRYALGNWWSRYHEYSESSYLELMERFQAANIPLSVAVLDMDWHLVENPFHSGWTGYTWNRELFPDPEGFLRKLHDMGLRVTVNLHPAGGVAPHEEGYQAMCRALGLDPEDGRTIDFDAASDAFMDASLRYLHRPLEEAGVDFFWIDWQQGSESAIRGLDPMWVLNERIYRDSERRGQRGLILSRYAGPGSHRCPVGFSGDTITSWASLRFQPVFTAMAACAGYPWWSHDIGGHMRGTRSDELSVRWLQFGVFSPIMRLHSSKSDFLSKEPWAFGKEAGEIMGAYLRLRHRLLPYLYTAMERTHRLGEAIVRPVYFACPEEHAAYLVPHEYLFGPSLLVVPVTAPMDPALRMAETQAWLPSGLWFDLDGRMRYTGNRMLRLYRTLDSYPVLAPAGTILPLTESPRADENPGDLTLRIFPGADGVFDLYEDDGISLSPFPVITHMRFAWQEGTLTLDAEGDLAQLPAVRDFTLECVCVRDTEVFLFGQVLPHTYDPESQTLRCTFSLPLEEMHACVRFEDLIMADSRWLESARGILHRAEIPVDEKEQIWRLLKERGNTPAAFGTIREIAGSDGLCRALFEVMFSESPEYHE
ncbi:MAG: DUF5110 domain-containing protein [Clostridia bacterium]|nr:DUF5110 domain-containing protein [Clostridia bacterium]